MKSYCQTPDLGQGLEFDFTFPRLGYPWEPLDIRGNPRISAGTLGYQREPLDISGNLKIFEFGLDT